MCHSVNGVTLQERSNRLYLKSRISHLNTDNFKVFENVLPEVVLHNKMAGLQGYYECVIKVLFIFKKSLFWSIWNKVHFMMFFVGL